MAHHANLFAAERAVGGLRVHTPRQLATPRRWGSGHRNEVEGLNMNAFSLGYLAAGLGAGLSVLGAGWGIGRLAAAAMGGTARQPAPAGHIPTSMIIAAAL